LRKTSIDLRDQGSCDRDESGKANAIRSITITGVHPMTRSRFSPVTRRRLVISSVVGGVVAATSGVDILTSLAGADLGTPEAPAPPPKNDTFKGTWNWYGNAGHSGELPGPGLDVSGALGELWRTSDDNFGGSDAIRASAYANGVLYTLTDDSLWARQLKDGAVFWTQRSAQIVATINASPQPSPVATPPADGEPVTFSYFITIDNDLVLVPASNGHLWALDAGTGELRWDFDSGVDDLFSPTIVDHVAYCSTPNGVCAVELGDTPKLLWQVKETEGFVIGVEGELVYVAVSAASADGDATTYEIRALTAKDGSEYWRITDESLLS
jgi:outer membrane protein assembly factor BamB